MKKLGIVPDAFTYNHLLRACAKTRKIKEATELFAFLKEGYLNEKKKC